MTSYEFIKNFSKIKITLLAKNNGINYSNIALGKASQKNVDMLKDLLLEKLLTLIDGYCGTNLTILNKEIMRLKEENKLLRKMIGGDE